MKITHGPATWKNKDYDQPINIIGYYGKKKGRHYVKIEGSSMGVPLDELVYPEKTSTNGWRQLSSSDWAKRDAARDAANANLPRVDVTPSKNPNGYLAVGGRRRHKVDINKVFPTPTDIKTVKIPTKVSKIVENADKTTKKITGKIIKPHKFNAKAWQQKKIKKDIADKAADWMLKTNEWGHMGIIGAAAVIGTASIIDAYNNAQDGHRSLKQQRIQEGNSERRLAKEDEDKYIGMGDLSTQQGLVQNMFNNRIGHTNTWGGKKY